MPWNKLKKINKQRNCQKLNETFMKKTYPISSGKFLTGKKQYCENVRYEANLKMEQNLNFPLTSFENKIEQVSFSASIYGEMKTGNV